MKTVLYYVSTENTKWKDVVVEDFRYICTSGLFKKCDKLKVDIDTNGVNGLLSGEEWIKFFWGRVDDDNKIEIRIHEHSDIDEWIKEYPDEEIIYSNTNYEINKTT